MEPGSQGQELSRWRGSRRFPGTLTCAEVLGLGRTFQNIPGSTGTPGARPQSVRVPGPDLKAMEPSDLCFSSCFWPFWRTDLGEVGMRETGLTTG